MSLQCLPDADGDFPALMDQEGDDFHMISGGAPKRRRANKTLNSKSSVKRRRRQPYPLEDYASDRSGGSARASPADVLPLEDRHSSESQAESLPSSVGARSAIDEGENSDPFDGKLSDIEPAVGSGSPAASHVGSGTPRGGSGSPATSRSGSSPSSSSSSSTSSSSSSPGAQSDGDEGVSATGSAIRAPYAERRLQPEGTNFQWGPFTFIRHKASDVDPKRPVDMWRVICPCHMGQGLSKEWASRCTCDILYIADEHFFVMYVLL